MTEYSYYPSYFYDVYVEFVTEVSLAYQKYTNATFAESIAYYDAVLDAGKKGAKYA